MGVGEVYAVGVDMDDPYNVYGGMQDHDSWKGPSNGPTGRDHARELGDGRPRRRHVQRRRSDRQPLGLQHARAELDGPDGSEDRRAHAHRAGRARRGSRGCATTGSRRSRSRRTIRRPSTPARRCSSARSTAAITGKRSARISRPTIPTKIGHNVPFCTITSISESPLTAGTIWVGTDDGKVQLTTNAGGAWTDLTPALDGGRRARGSLGQPRVRVAARRRHRVRRRRTASATTTSRRTSTRRPTAARRGPRSPATCPTAPINVVVQDRKNKNLLIVGNDVGVFVSIDGGGELDAAQGESADRGRPRPDDSSARERSGARHLRPRVLDRRHHAAAGAARATTLDKPAYLFDIEPRARYGFSTPGDELSPVRRQVPRGAERARGAGHQLLPEGGRAGGGEDHGQGRVRARSLRESDGSGEGGPESRAGAVSPAAAGAAVAAAGAAAARRRGPDRSRSATTR